MSRAIELEFWISSDSSDGAGLGEAGGGDEPVGLGGHRPGGADVDGVDEGDGGLEGADDVDGGDAAGGVHEEVAVGGDAVVYGGGSAPVDDPVDAGRVSA